jgi:prophage regulatory protein
MFENSQMGTNMTTASILKLPFVKGRTGLGRSSIYAAVKAGTFPAPVSLGLRAVGWLDSDITAWIESRPLAGGVAVPTAKGAA